MCDLTNAELSGTTKAENSIVVGSARWDKEQIQCDRGESSWAARECRKSS